VRYGRGHDYIGSNRDLLKMLCAAEIPQCSELPELHSTLHQDYSVQHHFSALLAFDYASGQSRLQKPQLQRPAFVPIALRISLQSTPF